MKTTSLTAVPREIEVTKDAIRKILTANVAIVTFEKTNGEMRKMKCTLNEKFLPPVDETVEKKERKKSEDSIAVWDLEKKGWRSFRYESMKNIEFGLALNEEHGIY